MNVSTIAEGEEGVGAERRHLSDLRRKIEAPADSLE